MKAVLLAVVLCFAVVAAYASNTEEFIAFTHNYGKNYASAEEFNYRLSVFNSNIERAAALQRAANGTTTYGVTKYMDLTPQEFSKIVLMSKMGKPSYEGEVAPPQNLTTKAPTSFDWRSRAGIVTPVYNQGQCGSCWAFSATENIESQWAMKGHGLQSLSMQQIVDCDKTSYGCNGGWTYSAYQYVISAGGIEHYQNYPYTARTDACKFNAAHIDAKLRGWVYVTQSRNEGQMVDYLVANGPLSICVDAQPWQFYKGGVLAPAQCGTSIDHCVDIVGYNTAANPPYWIVRNSWGTDWGIAGYIYLQYGHDTCALAQVVTNSQVA